MNFHANHELALERTREHLREAARRHLIAHALASRPPRPSRPPRHTRSLADVWRRLSGWRSFRFQPRGGDA